MKLKTTCGLLVVLVIGAINVVIFSNYRVDDENNTRQLLKIERKFLSNERIEESLQNETILSTHYVIPVLVMAYNHDASATKRSLDQVLKLRPSDKRFPLIVSQDGSDRQITKVIASYGKRIKFIKQPDLSVVQSRECTHPIAQVHCKNSRHYKWALTQVFDVMNFNVCIVLEDNIEIAPDFFNYFAATRFLFDIDSSIFCVSAWNDNSYIGQVKGKDVLYRSDFFPVLGWMLKKSHWNVLKPKWPVLHWEDWLMRPEQKRSRVCIYPEIPRVKIVDHKSNILNDQPYHFKEQELLYLVKKRYDKVFLPKVYSLPLVTLENVELSGPEVRLQYSSKKEFMKFASHLGLTKDFKSGIPRTSYKGVVSCIHNGVRVFLAPLK